MNFNNVKVPKVPSGGAASALVKFGIFGALGLYGLSESIYNVEGGHRAIVFNRLQGIKNQVNLPLMTAFVKNSIIYYLYYIKNVALRIDSVKCSFIRVFVVIIKSFMLDSGTYYIVIYSY